MSASMARGVPLGRRNLFEDRRRSLLAFAGIGVGLLMVLLMVAIFAGMIKQESAYIDSSPGEVFIAQSGIKTLQFSESTLPSDAVARVGSVPGVVWAEPLRQLTGPVNTDKGSMLAYLFGYDTDSGRAGPRHMREGKPPGPGEVVIDAVGAAQLQVGIGDSVRLYGVMPLKISGISTGLAGLGNTTMFVTVDQFAQIAGPKINWVVASSDGALSGRELAQRIADALPEASVQTRAQFSAQQAGTIRDIYGDVVVTMIAVGFLIALALVALTLSTVTSSKLREFGIVKSMGATSRDLVTVVLSQALWAIGVSMAGATVLALLMARLFTAVVPNVLMIVEPTSVLYTALAAFVIGLPAALAPLRRVLHVDPASAFRAGT